MNRYLLAAILAVGLALVTAVFLSAGVHAPTEGARPNIVLIVIDTLRADRIDAQRNGVPVMPYLASLARASRRFDHAVTPCTWTRPAMASLFTGQYVDTHQVYYSVEKEDLENPTSDTLHDRWETLAEYLAKHGYDTFGVQTNENLRVQRGFGQGFADGDYVFLRDTEADKEADADVVSDTALAKLPELTGPFFTYLHYMDVHVPYDPPQKYREIFGPPPPLTQEDEALFLRFMDLYRDCVNVFLGLVERPQVPRFSPAGIEATWALYDGEARFADDQVKRVIETIRARHPNTLFIVTSDHGEEFWERGGMGHGTTLFEEQLHVPLLVHGPGIAPATVHDTVESIGLLRTLAQYGGLPAKTVWQGADLLQEPPSGPAFSRTLGPRTRLNVDVEAILFGDYKLILNNSAAETRLFNWRSDPAEKTDLAVSMPARCGRLLAILKRHRETNRRARPPGLQRVRVQLDPDDQERLRALGYMNGDE